MKMSKIEGAIIYEGAANHYAGIEGVGGKLYLTQNALVFISHKLNIQNHELVIPIVEIETFSLSNNLGFVPNGLTIHTKSGKNERFVVNRRKVWAEKMSEVRGF